MRSGPPRPRPPLLLVRRLLALALALATLGAASPPGSSRGATHGGPNIDVRAKRMVDVVSGTLRENVLIRIGDGRILAIEDAAKARRSSGRMLVDLGDLTLLPGLIDSHVHLTLAGDPDSNAYATLRAGFTTVLDLGAVSGGNLALRKRIESGAIHGPRMICAGAWRGVAGGTCDFGGIGVRGADSFRARVQEDVAAGADVVKVCVDGWPGQAFERPDSVEIGGEELAAVMAEARLAKRPVYAHATGRAGVRTALQAGAHAIAHANFADSATVAEMARRRLFVIPTLASIMAQGRDTPWGQALSRNMRRLLASDVPVAFGTDAGVLPHGMNAHEFRALARHGLSPIAALRTATLGGAELLGRGDRLGRIAPGYAADLIGVEGNPLDSVQVLERVRFVMKGGRVVRNDPGLWVPVGQDADRRR